MGLWFLGIVVVLREEGDVWAGAGGRSVQLYLQDQKEVSFHVVPAVLAFHAKLCTI